MSPPKVWDIDYICGPWRRSRSHNYRLAIAAVRAAREYRGLDAYHYLLDCARTYRARAKDDTAHMTVLRIRAELLNSRSMP